jgi:hypothetical protein
MTNPAADSIALASEWHKYNLQGQSYDQIAQAYGTTRGTVAGAIRRWMQTTLSYSGLAITPIRLTGDWVITGDVHVPDTDWKWAGRVVEVGKKYGIKKLAIIGDIFNMDAFSTFAETTPSAAWTQERDAARLLLGGWLNWFDEIQICMGNHDRRLEKWAGGNLDEQDIFGMVLSNPRVKTSQFGWCDLSSNGVPWRLTHPRNYGRNQLAVASDLANKYSTNIISFHEHHLAMGYDVYGRWVIANGGTLVDPGKLAYVNLDDSRMPAMMQGFTAVKGGCLKLFGTEPFTDWRCL